MKKIVYVRDLPLGDGNITIQSMTNTDTKDIRSTSEQILELKQAGADLVRVSLPDEESAKAVFYYKQLGIPIIGDCHFGAKAALIAIENGIDKIRINPGNMTDDAIKQIVSAAKEHSIPIRIGVNKGSVKVHNPTPKQLAQLAYEQAQRIEDMGYDKLVLAVKTSDVRETIAAYRILDKLCSYPLHIGLTESGTASGGIIKSAVAVGSLLYDGIGDTVRVSLSGDPVKEIYAAKKILQSLNIDKNYVNIIACPTCARTKIDVEKIALCLEEQTKNYKIPLTIAVMGCTVNGIGESKGADFGVAGGKDKSSIFINGKIAKQVNNDKILQELLNIVEQYKDGNAK